MRGRRFAGILLTGSCLALLSCPSPLDETMVLHVKDAIGPVITITSPAAGSCCANIVEIVGTVTDAATAAANDGDVRTLSYSVPGSAVAGPIECAPDGAFSFPFSTVTLGTNFTLVIEAIDWNGNSSTASLPLLKLLDNGIPSFAVTPGNHEVTVSWDPVPHTASYTLFNTTNGGLPSEETGIVEENVTSPHVLSNLHNGNLHVFQLKAVPDAGWPESLSDCRRTIPLSPQSLAPVVRGEIRQIRVEWPSIPATGEFEVWRSTQQDGVCHNISGALEATSYVDTGVSNDTWYWYKVRPALEGCTASFPNGAQTDPFCRHSPMLVATCKTTEACDVAIGGSFAYVADGSAGLRVIDISTPSLPTLRATCPTTSAWGVTIDGAFAYVADGAAGLRVIDITNPLAPVPRGTCGTADAADVAVSGNYAYAADNNEGLRVIYIQNPDAPTLLGSCFSSVAVGVAINGTYAFVADNNSGLLLIDVSNASGVAVNGHYAYVSDYCAGLRVIDVSVTPTAVLQGTCATSYAGGVAVAGSYAYVADGGSGLRVVDISNPALPILAATCPTNYACGVVVSGPYAYIADGSGLCVIDISEPSSPVVTGSCRTTMARGLAVSGSYAYVADAYAGLRVIDISIPASPTLKGTCMTTNDSFGVAVSGSYAYLANGASGLRVIDIANPYFPTSVAVYTAEGEITDAVGVAINGSVAYVVCADSGLYVIDIANPRSPSLVDSFGFAPSPTGVAVRGSYAYATAQSGLRVFDISSGINWMVVTGCATFNASGVAVSGSHAYVVDFNSGLLIVDLSP